MGLVCLSESQAQEAVTRWDGVLVGARRVDEAKHGDCGSCSTVAVNWEWDVYVSSSNSFNVSLYVSLYYETYTPLDLQRKRTEG